MTAGATPFPPGFLWRGTTSANQIEGAYDPGGKGLSIQDEAPKGVHGIRRPAPTADNLKLVGIDFSHRYATDIALFAELGLPGAQRTTASGPDLDAAREEIRHLQRAPSIRGAPEGELAAVGTHRG
jgi:hypothetical protein